MKDRPKQSAEDATAGTRDVDDLRQAAAQHDRCALYDESRFDLRASRGRINGSLSFVLYRIVPPRILYKAAACPLLLAVNCSPAVARTRSFCSQSSHGMIVRPERPRYERYSRRRDAVKPRRLIRLDLSRLSAALKVAALQTVHLEVK